MRRLVFHGKTADITRKVLFWRLEQRPRGMKDFLVCLSSGELALIIWPLVMFVLFVLAMCGAFVKQCREDGLCIRRTESALNV